MSTIQPVQVPTEDRHFIVTETPNVIGSEMLERQPMNGFEDEPAARIWAEHDAQLSKNAYRTLRLPGATGYITALIREDDEDSARRWYGDRAVDTYFEEIEGLDVFAARVDIPEFVRQLERIGEDVQRLAESIGFPDPGAATAEDLLREMWAKVHAHDARQIAEHGLAINETRALGLAG